MADEIRILLLEDDRANRLVISELLRAAGYEVLTAENGQQGLEFLDTEAPVDVVITDAEMPVLDGRQTTRAIRATTSLAALPIIGLTGHDAPEETRLLHEAGVDLVLVKPTTLATLRQAIGAVVRSQPAPVAPPPEPSPESHLLPLWQRDDLLARVEGDQDFLVELVSLFLADLPRQLQQLQRCLDDQHLESIRRTAHGIKGASANASAARMREASLRLEHAARDGRPLHELQVLHDRLVQAWEHTQAAMRESLR